MISAEAENKILALFAEGRFTSGAIAARLGLRRDQVADVLRIAGYPIPHPVVTQQERDQIVEMYRRGMTMTEISRKTQRSMKAIRKALRQQGELPQRTCVQMTDAQVQEAVADYEARRATIEQLAVRYGVHKETMRDTLRPHTNIRHAGGRTPVARDFDLESLLIATANNEETMATETGMSSQYLRELRQTGLTYVQADRFACKLGFHPGTIWPNWFSDALLEEAS